ncbi:hypothetical protein GIB67_015166 [Kingdonia uniflora]|uniref:Cation efflux protein cytoplasmic domain-containing protein n=1 Tax=Kingdonia uniflora TaxID=39325 RepID=A0A7J7LJH7_9MAGN|nr:hypothetical protein GIB67_015166 [Kingdonia uniflora]
MGEGVFEVEVMMDECCVLALDSVMELVDAGVPLPLLNPIKQTILKVEGVKGCHHLRGRRAGSSIHLDVHIEVDPFSSVSAAHDIGEGVRRDIQNSHSEVAEVFIHIDPAVAHLSSSTRDQQADLKGMSSHNSNACSEQKDIEAIVSNIFSTKFSEIIILEHITYHSLQGKFFLQIEVSMPFEMLIRDAKEIAEEAEKEILNVASNISQVSIQLRLGHLIPQFHHESRPSNNEERSETGL